MIPCQHRKRVINRTEIDGAMVDVFRCVLEEYCTATEAGLIRRDGTPMAACEQCTKQNDVATPEQIARTKPTSPGKPPDCIHKLPVIRTEPCELCGSKFGPKGTLVEISGCALHGECAPARYKAGQVVRSCATCADRTG
jgi:hypothetical protein